jgi:hypothetical protein
MNGEEKLAEFLQVVEDWTKSKYIVEVKPPQEIADILNADSEDMQQWNYEKCNISAF